MLVLYRAVLSVSVLLVGRFCMEFLLLCLGEGDGEEKIKHKVQLCVCGLSSTGLQASELFFILFFKVYLYQGYCWWCLWYSALYSVW